jgi:RimJ/RimL family protein N-acetyltransferase
LLFRNGNRQRLAHHGTLGIDVHGDFRGRGIGAELMKVLLDWAAANPLIEKVCLGTFANNAGARKLYERLGFREEGRQLRFFKMAPGEYADDVQMSIYTKPAMAPEGFLTWELR